MMNSRGRKRKTDGQDELQLTQNNKKIKPSEQENSSIFIKICTWNIGHISKENTYFEKKCLDIYNLLIDNGIDLLVLQEVNQSFDNFDKSVLEKFTNKGYSYHSGPHLKTGDNQNTGVKESSQNEYYVVFYKKERISISKTFVIEEEINREARTPRPFRGNFTGKATKEGELVKWVSYRPVVMREVQVDRKFNFLLGVVHTSPSFKVQASVDYVEGAEQVATKNINMHWILAGDWYVEPEAKINSQKGQTWSAFLASKHYKWLKPDKQTNFPNTGGGMIADYFVVSANMPLKGHKTEVISHQNDQEFSKTGWHSDHAPVLTTLEILHYATATSLGEISTYRSIFPHHEYGLTIGMSNEPVLLNGMKVIFDQPVGVYPVTLDPKDKEHRNGNRN